ncbi:MAG TPA: SRPBCC family protein [Acetobacteraceae bacterium]|nr:SRPBCC family protein [Acetobacteraceae bacterium]
MPQLTQTFELPFPPPLVWRMFGNVEQVVGCFPGAAITAPLQDNRFTGELRVKLGPIATAFAGEAELEMDATTQAGRLRGQGIDRKNNSRARSELGFALVEQPGGTRVDVTIEYTLTGTLAQFSRGAIVQELAQRLTTEFARNLEARLAADSAQVPQAILPDAAPAKELNLGGLLWSMLVTWLRRSFGRLHRDGG